MNDLTIEGKILIFKSLVVLKFVHLALIKSVPILTIERLNIVKKNFIWQGKKTKIEQCTLCNSNENGDLKDVDIFYKIISLQCSWIRRIFDNNFYDWKVIALFLIKKKFEENFKFHSNVYIPKCSLNNFPCFYKETVTRWKKLFPFLLAYLQQLLLSFFGSINVSTSENFQKVIKLCKTIVWFRREAKKLNSN